MREHIVVARLRSDAFRAFGVRHLFYTRAGRGKVNSQS
jgi:hypothetical protein